VFVDASTSRPRAIPKEIAAVFSVQPEAGAG